MIIDFISPITFQKRCEKGELYRVDCGELTGEGDLRRAAIDDFETRMRCVGDDLFVSDFINRARLIFIDVDVKVLNFNLLSDLKMWVLNDKHQHAIMCGVYNQKEYLGKFLVNRENLICDKSLRKLPVFQ